MYHTCQKESETTEHLIECKEIGKRIQPYKGKGIAQSENLKDATEMAKYLDTIANTLEIIRRERGEHT